MDLRSATLALHRLQNERLTKNIDNGVDSGADSTTNEKSKGEEEEKLFREKTLSEFMRLAGEPITWIESRELCREMLSTNNGRLPKFDDSFLESSRHCLRISVHGVQNTIAQGAEMESEQEATGDLEALEMQNTISDFADGALADYAASLARVIKETYSIRLRNDKSELYFILGSITFLWAVTLAVGIAGVLLPENAKLGTLTPAIFVESFSLFAIELAWECILSWVVLRFNIKINYTRKLGNLIKVPKYFIADFLPIYTSSALSMMMALAISQTLFAFIFYRRSRERFTACAYLFLSQDRREDRPDTLIFQITEDIMRFAIYFPFKLLVDASKAIIFIPIAVNNIGDGLAEPIGVAWGKHKYATTALYHKGRFFHSKFTRSYEGSACVFVTTFIVVAANYNAFNPTQFWTTFAILPFLMTIAEAKAPHTNDGPFLALVGCGFLTIMFLFL